MPVLKVFMHVSLICIFGLISLSDTFGSQPDHLDRYFNRKMKQANIIGMQVASIGGDTLQWTGSYGLSNFETGEPVNDSTLFMIASCSKPVTALALLKLYDEGKFKLDDDINDYLPFTISNPNFPDVPITFRMLLAHCSSLRDNWDILDPLYTVKEGGDSPLELEQFIKDYFTPGGKFYNAETNFAKENPGSGWAYCNMGYALIGLLIEKISGMSFSDYLHQHIFLPLGMPNSYWFLREIKSTNIARPHVLPDKKSDANSPELLPHYGYPDFPDGQLRTTVSDYARVVSLILNKGRIGDQTFISEPVIEEFLSIQFPEVNKWQAIAWNYNEFENWMYYLFMPHLPSHTGGDPGVATVVSFDPDQGVGAIVFVNSPPVTFRGGKIFYLNMVRKLLKKGKRDR